jgi:Mitochondrial carrier protein
MSQQPKSDYTKPAKSSLPAKLISGAVAGVMGTLVIFPIDFVKTNLQAQKSLNLPQFISKIYSQKGVAGFYRINV